MIIFESYEEYNELMSEITSTLRSVKKLEKEEPEGDTSKDDPVGGEVPLDEVLPPSKGHTVGGRVPNTSSKNQPYYGGPFMEHSLEERLCSLLEEIGSNNQSDNAQRDAGQGQVGVTAVLGHGTGKPDDPRSPMRDDYAKVKKANRDAKDPASKGEDSQDDSSEEMEDALKSLGLDPDEASTAPPI
jgi:hypothetical protein